MMKLEVENSQPIDIINCSNWVKTLPFVRQLGAGVKVAYVATRMDTFIMEHKQKEEVDISELW